MKPDYEKIKKSFNYPISEKYHGKYEDLFQLLHRIRLEIRYKLIVLRAESLEAVLEAAKEAIHKFETMSWRNTSEKDDYICVTKSEWKELNLKFMTKLEQAIKEAGE